MSVPGSNLLAQAMTLIRPQVVRYYRDIGRVTSATGRDVTTRAGGVDVPGGSLQAVPLTRYESMGLDYKKKYVTWFVSLNVVGIDRDRSGDQFAYNGRRYDVVGESNWFQQDGWVGVVGIDVGADNAG